MRNIGVNFNGRHIIHPGASARVDADALTTLGNLNSKKIAFVGSSTGGQPGTVLTFSNPSDAKAVLKSGDLVKAAELAWAPSGDGVGAGEIAFIRVESALQASLVKGSMTFTSSDWGADNNKIQVKLEDGSAVGSKKLTFYYWPTDLTESYDNIGPIFNVQYKGTGTAATLDITQDANGVANLMTIKVDSTTVMSYTLGDGQYLDINKIVADINNHVDFAASMVTYGNKNLRSDQLDAVAAQDIKTANYVVLALKGDTIFQTRYSQLLTIAFGTGAYPANFDYTFLAGGSDGTVPASWADKFDLLYGEGVYIVTPLTADEAIQAECQRFVETQSALERSLMLGVYGGSLGESIDDVIARSLTLNSSRAIVAYPGVTRSVSEGTTETLAPYFTAALIAGRTAGKETGDPITLDYLNLIGVEKVLKGSEIDRLIEAGVTVVEFVRQAGQKGYRIAQGVTTYQVDSNPSYREISMRIVSDELSTELVEHLEDKFAGGKGTVSSIALIKNEVQSFLDKKKRDEVIVDYDPNSVVVRLEGDTVYVDYSCIPVGAINYILITAMYYQQQIIA